MNMFSKRNSRKKQSAGSKVVIDFLEPRQLLSGTAPSLNASATVLPFNAALSGTQNGGPSRVETVTVSNNGSGFLIFDSGAFTIVANPTATNSAPSAFAIINAGSLPANLAPGASANVQLQYTPGIVGLQQAILEINSNDPTTPSFHIDLNGIGTNGQFGVDEPSLAQVMRSYDIPTIVGAGPNDANLNTQKYPITPDPSSQEVPMQRMVAAQAGQPVTITPIASFSAATPAISRIGYYTPGDPNHQTELFYIGINDAQTVQPTAIGATSFMLGTTPFGLYATFPGTTTSNGSLDTHYSEDALNVLDPTHERKVRFFPYENANGTVVPNTFIFAMEDFNDPTQFNSFINFVGLISNVQAAPNATAGSVPSSTTGHNPAAMSVQAQMAQGSSNLVFNTIAHVNSISPDIVHNTNVVTITNTGDQALTINSLTLSDTKNWMIVNPPAAGTTIAGNSSLAVTVKFIATGNPPHSNNQTDDITSTSGVSSVSAGGVWTGTLTINSSDTTKTLNLAGYWQYESEHENEPGFPTLTNLMFGYTTNVTGASSFQGEDYPNNGNTPVTYGAEIDPSTSQGLFLAADPSQPVTLRELAAFHQQYQSVDATVGTTTFGVKSGSESGTTVTLTTSGNNTFKLGDQVSVNGVVGVGLAAYNGTFTITAILASNMFTYTVTTTGLVSFSTAPTQPQSGWYPQGGSTKFIYKDQANNGQSVFPGLTNDSFSTYRDNFTPTGAFGLNIDGEKSQDSQNSAVDTPFNTSGHAVRFFPVIDANGKTIPNTYLVGMDYRNYEGPNGDYQDLYEIVSNVTFQALPATPIDLQASIGTTGVNLQWAPMNSVKGYNVYQVINGTSVKLTSTPITTTSFTDTTAPIGTLIQYRVTAVNASAESPAAVASISPAGVTPAAPSIQSVDGSSGNISVTWNSVTGATSYIVSREGPGENSFTVVASNITATSFIDTDVTSGQTYQYIVQAQNASGVSPNSSTGSTTAGQSSTGLAAPSIQLANGSSGTQVVLTWNTVSGASSYTVLREGPGEYSFTPVASNLTSPTFTDTQVTPGATYQYVVSAQAGATTSPTSAPASATVSATAATLAAPTNLSTDVSTGTTITLNWSASAGAATYSVERESPGSSTFVTVQSGLTTTSYTDTNVVQGVTYEYVVQAFSGADFSPISDPVPGMLATSAGSLSVTVGTKTNKFLQFADSNGTVTIIKMTGVGVATVALSGSSTTKNSVKGGAVVSGDGISVANVTITGANRASGLSITTRGGNGTVSIGGISSNARMANINAPKATLIGSLAVAGGVPKILLGSANAASISIGGAIQTLSIVAASGLSVTASGAIRTITSKSWNSSAVLSAPSINAINIAGPATLNVSTGILRTLKVKGALTNSTLTLTAPGALDIASLIAGSVSNTNVNASGNIGTVSTASLTSSQIFAGVASINTLPAATTDFSASSFITAVNLKKTKGSESFVDSQIAASLIKHVSLGNVQFANAGNPFGVVAEDIVALSLADPTSGKTDVFSKLSSQDVVTADLAAKGIAPQDFVVQIV